MNSLIENVCQIDYKQLRQVQNLYSSSYRFYHNWGHISKMLELSILYNISLTKSQFYAIVFHDVVYNVNSSDNEEQSVDVLYSFFDKNDANVQKAAEIILATKHHVYDQNVDDEVATVLDLDLYGLSVKDYCSNMLNLYKEYTFFNTSSDWKRKRVEFLRQLLTRKKLYYMLPFDEEIARNNIQLELLSRVY